jgi:hypothetical protein
LSLGAVNVQAEVGLALNISLEVGHLKVVVDPIYNKIWEPRVFSRSLEQLIEELKAFLPKVISEKLEAH